MSERFAHEMPFGAAVQGDGSVRFRLWAPSVPEVTLRLEGGPALPMTAVEGGWFECATDRARAGSRYRFALPDGLLVPDPAARFQPLDVNGPSEVVDPGAYPWRRPEWRGRPWEEVVLYELHVGTFSAEGTYAGAVAHLDHLVDLGVTAVELMPLAQTAGRRNWGYDGVLLFAPHSAYGTPEELKALVDACHERGLMIFLDVVYNHFGPEGNYLNTYARSFFTERHHTPWGAAINYDGADARPVRDFVIDNALYWLQEYRFDGLRLDAVHAIIDDGSPDILSELAHRVRAAAGPDRHVHLVLENDANQARYLARGDHRRAFLYEAQWNDDFHHVAHVLATGERAHYYTDFADRPAERMARALAGGFVYQGDPSPFRGGEVRGEPSGHLPPTAFVNFLQNHDQIGNRASGERLSVLASPGRRRCLTALLLLAPSIPLLFMGEEWAEVRPFLYFCDFHGGLADAVREGRRREFAGFPEFADESRRAEIPDPNGLEAFAASRLDWAALGDDGHAAWHRYTSDLLRLRREEIVPRLDGIGPGRVEWQEGEALCVAWPLAFGGTLAVLANLGDASVAAPHVPVGRCIGGSGTAPVGPIEDLPGWTALWFVAE